MALIPPIASAAPNIEEKKEPVETTPLAPLVVTASRVESDVMDLPLSAIVLRQEDFAPQTRFAVDALSSVVGIRVDNRPGETLFSGFEIRGLSTNDTSGTNALIMLDGIPQRRLSFGGPYLGTLPFAAVDRMELIKGPLGSIYGRGALTGALQLFTNPGTDEWHLNTSTAYRSDLESLFGSLQITGPIAGLTGGTLSFTASGKDAEGWQPWTNSNMQDYYLHLHLPLGADDTVTLTGGWHDGKDDNASPVPITASGDLLLVEHGANLSIPGHNYMDMQEFRAAVAWEHRFDDTLRSNISVGYWNGQTEMFLGRPTDGPNPGSTVVNRLTQERYWQEDSWIGQFELQKEIKLGGNITATLTAGGSLEYLTWNNTSRSLRVPSTTFAQGIPLDLATMIEPDPSTYIYGPWGTRDTSESDYGGFIRSQLDCGDAVTVFAGLRYDGYRREQENLTSGASSTVTDSAYSPAAGILWHAYKSGGTVVNPYFSWGRGFAPVFRGVGTTEIVQIDPETSESFELGIKSEFADGKVQAEASIYQIERLDVIAFDATTASYGNFGDWRIRGVETSVSWQPVDALKGYANFTYREPIVDADPTNPGTVGKDVPMVPRTIAKCGVEYHPAEAWTIGLEGAYYGDSYNTPLNTVKVSDYFLVNAQVSYQWKNYRITGFVTNLFDQEYASSAFAVVNGAVFEGLPRGFGLKLDARF